MYLFECQSPLELIYIPDWMTSRFWSTHWTTNSIRRDLHAFLFTSKKKEIARISSELLSDH